LETAEIDVGQLRQGSNVPVAQIPCSERGTMLLSWPSKTLIPKARSQNGKFSEPCRAVRPKKLPKITVVGARKFLHRNNSVDTAAISVGAHGGRIH
jgi:hypothetical protein